MLKAQQALQRLIDGNQRFVSGVSASRSILSPAQSDEQVADQEPFAVILGCSDSRVPAEIVFDQGLGDLFVIRVAGNVVAPSQIGSVEFAVSQFKTQLVVVLGHTMCGAICATVNVLKHEQGEHSRNIRSIVDRIRPSVESFKGTELWQNTEALISAAVRSNVRSSVNQLRHGSETLENAVNKDGLLIVGAEYSLETGCVEFFDGIQSEHQCS
ncbi:MAG: carbonic anhydrase [gamma proteobacterium symbiont of Bathyaustriella thionipta]|nr:carbonic anhydrase [gamma proteobacterium symbiont of Bathyaustriella thionipta]